MPTIRDVDPDDAFSIVPYEKGSSLLMYLEQKLGGPGSSLLNTCIYIYNVFSYTYTFIWCLTAKWLDKINLEMETQCC